MQHEVQPCKKELIGVIHLLIMRIAIFGINMLLIVVLLVIQVSYLRDFSVQRRRPEDGWQIDGYDGVNVFFFFFKFSPSATVSPFLCCARLSLSLSLCIFEQHASLVQIQFENAALLPVVALCQ